MDTSTPLKKSYLSRKQLEPTASKSSNYFSQETNRVNAVEPEPSDSCPRHADARTCVEVFPLPVSPICCTQNVTTDLLGVPYLDSSNLKWSSSLHTSFAGNETDEVVEIETESADWIRSPNHYCPVADSETKTETDGNESDDGKTGIDDGKFTTSNPPHSPIFVTGGNYGRSRNGSARRRRIKEPLSDEREDGVQLDVLKLDNLHWQNTCESATATSKTGRYTFDAAREISKRFVYPSAGVCIKKPQRSLKVDQLTSCALSLEVCDGKRSSLSSDSIAHSSRPSVGDVARARVENKSNMYQSAGTSSMVRFSRLLSDSDGNKQPDGEKINSLVPALYIDVDKLYPKPNVTRALARIMFASKNNDNDTVQARFVKLVDQLTNADDAGYRVRAGVTRLLYLVYYFVARVNVASYATDRFYQRAFIRQLIDDVSTSFKLDLRFDYAANVFERIVDDIYVLEKTMAIPVVSIYATRSKALHGRCITLINVDVDDGRVAWFVDENFSRHHYRRIESGFGSERLNSVRVRRNVRKIMTGVGATIRLFQSESDCWAKISTGFAGSDVESAYTKCKNGDTEPLDFNTCTGRTKHVGDESLRRVSECLYCDISTDSEFQRSCDGDGEIGIVTATLGLTSRPAHLFPNISKKKECSLGVDNVCKMNMTASGFKTVSGKTLNVDDELLRKSKRLFSDISTEAEFSFGAEYDVKMNMATSGFKTGSGKTINIDDESLRKSKRLFSDISIEAEFSHSKEEGVKMNMATSGFKTGSGKTINVDDESLRKSERLFSDISIEAEFSHSKEEGVKMNMATSGFKTGSGKTINVDDELLRMSEHLFSDISTKTQFSLGADYDVKMNMATSGFKTGSGKTINVDDELLRKSERLFSDISTKTEFSLGAEYDVKMNMATSGFKTGSGKTINVDDESLRMSADLFSNVSLEEKSGFGFGFSGGDKFTTEVPGFKTSSGKTINVDGSSLRMSTHLFSDMLSETQKGTSTNASLRAPDAGVDANVAPEVSAFKTDAGNVVNVKAKSSERCESLPADCAVSVTSLEYAYPSKTKAEVTKTENERSERQLCSQQNQSFDLGREITESTSAFLYDISREQSWCSFFASNESYMSTDVNPNESARSSSVDYRCESDAGAYDSYRQNKIATSRSCSPVFDSKYGSSKRKCSTRKNNGRQSLDVTFVRKTKIAAAVGDDAVNNDRIHAELEMLKMNFSCKASKRKSSSADDWNALVTAKKCKNDAAASLSPPLQSEQLALSSSASRNSTVALQQSYISNKPKENCRPTRGYLSTLIYGDGYRSRISLSYLTRYEKPRLYTFDEYLKFGLLPVVIRMNSQNARNFAFTSQFFSDQQLKSSANGATLFGDAVPIIFNEKNQVTLEEVIAGFLASPGVDPKLVSREWLSNHYRWIVWKLASTEKFFPKLFGGRYLTLDNVLFQLKFKYEQEVDRCVRSALKRILEGDDTPTRPVILCVASIAKETHSSDAYKMELTDGWYGIFARTDHQIDELIARKKILVGTKLIIVGAELVGLREPCDPLQASENIRIKFSANSSRRVRWDTRLGFFNDSSGPINRIQTILPKGGFVSHLTAVVARVYPSLFLEKFDNAATTADVSATKTASWSRVHNEKVEMKKAAAFEKDRQSFIESILSQVTNQVLSENSKTDAYTFADNERLREVVQQRVQSRLPEKLSKNRHVSRLLKLRLVDAQDVKYKSSAILTIWNPCDDVTNFFKEGRLYKFFNINANCIRNGDLQLCSTRSSQYDGCSASTNATGDNGTCWFERRVRSIEDFNKRCEEDEKGCPFDEVDVTGVVIKIKPKTEILFGRNEPSCRIYLADLQRKFLALSFRIDSKNFDFGDSLENGKIVAGLNLQWKKGWLCWKIPVLCVSDLSSFVQSTNIASLRQNIDEIRRHFQNQSLETFVADCEEKLKDIVNASAAATSTIDGSGGDSSSSSSDNAIVTEGSVHQMAAKSLTESDFFNETRLLIDDQHAFKNSDKRSKFEKLQNYGRPPALSPIVLTSRSKIKSKLPLPVSRRSSKS